MFTVSHKDYVSLENYPFGWRWIDKDRVSIPENEAIYITWTERKAIETRSDIFVKYWNTFC